jgi:hypothetical protein
MPISMLSAKPPELINTDSGWVDGLTAGAAVAGAGGADVAAAAGGVVAAGAAVG